MKRALAISAFLTACLAGIAAGQWMIRSAECRDAIGLLFGHGHLLALAHGRGIYESDVDRAAGEKADATGAAQDRQAGAGRGQISRSLIVNNMARALGEQQKIGSAEIDRELDLLRWQLGDARQWSSTLRTSGLGARSLRRIISDDLRAEHWVQQRIEPDLRVTGDECRALYEMDRQAFVQPDRFRASHLFLAAPPDTPADVVDQKRGKIEALGQRLAAGEDFVELVALESEDEATKAGGGDLGFFAESRIPADFFAAVRKLELGRISQPVRTQLGFHIIRVTDFKPARQMTLEEVQPEIARSLENQKRRIAISYLPAELIGHAEFIRP